MGRQSKATKARHSNLGWINNPQNPSVEDAFKDEDLDFEDVIRERGLWLEKGLNAQCESFKCVAGKKDCCCRRLLFTQPDFVHQKSHLEELIKS